MASKPAQGFAASDLVAVSVKVILWRKSNRAVLLAFPDGTQQQLTALLLYKHKDDRGQADQDRAESV